MSTLFTATLFIAVGLTAAKFHQLQRAITFIYLFVYVCGKVRGQPARGSALPPACGSQGLNSGPKTGAPTTEPTQQTTSPCLKSKVYTHVCTL